MHRRDPRSSWQFLPGRRLLFEALERRDLLAVMRVVDWNTLNEPNNATDDANFRTVLEAIGNETVQGNTQRIDILALQETDPPGSGDSIGRIQNVLNSLYATTSYNVVASPVDGGGDSTGFVYDSSTVTLLNSVQVGAGTLTHNVMRGEFQPVGSPASAIFYVYSVHLKSSATGADAATRGSEAAFLRADADSLGDGTQVLFVGDFNMNGSNESAWTNIVAAGAGQLQDVANAPGNWSDNEAFKTLHSQDPGAAMDDRFDIQFASGEFFDGGGVDYVPNSFHIFGNNGTHTLNGRIDTGTGASPEVLAALIAASDHLPAVADYKILAFTPSVIVSQTLASTKAIEGGLYDTYQLVLNTVPTADVIITVTPDAQVDVGNGAGVAKQLTFTPANALTPQTVIVRAADDGLAEGDHAGLITHSSTSADATYNGLSVSSVDVSIVDNDAPTIVINEIDPDQVGTDAAEFIELFDGGVGNASLTGYTIVLFNGAAANNVSYATYDLTGKTTNSDGFFVLGNSGVSPTPGLIFPGNSFQNGADGVGLYFGVVGTVANNTPPTAAQLSGKLKDAIVYNNSGTQDADLIADLNPGQPQVNENQNGLGTTQSLSRVPDGGTPLDTTNYVAQIPTPGAFNQAIPAGVLVLQSAQRVEVTEGGTADSYQIALLSIPMANVQVTVDPDDQTDLGAGAGVAIVLTFTPANALIPQTVSVTAVDDAAAEGTHTSTITHSLTSTDSRYEAFSVPNVVATITDNDSIVALAGDYNHNSAVDAGDYVLWRKTLGSTTSLQADGSGPTIGVPNGVVDEADYTYWRSNFGNTSPGTGAGQPQSLVGSGLDTPTTMAAEQSAATGASSKATAIDAALADLSRCIFSSGNEMTRTACAISTSGTASDIELLLSIRPPSQVSGTVAGEDPSSSVLQESAGVAADNVFASLDESATTPAGLLLSVI